MLTNGWEIRVLQFNNVPVDGSVQFNDVPVVLTRGRGVSGSRQFRLIPEELWRSDDGWKQMFWMRDKSF